MKATGFEVTSRAQTRAIEVQRRYPIYTRPGLSDVEYSVETLRSHINHFFECSAQEEQTLLHNFEGETIYIEYNDKLAPQPLYTLFSDYGYGRGKTLKECMHRWVNIDDEDDTTEFARRSRTAGEASRRAQAPYLPELRSIRLHDRRRGAYL